jgi:hypothetical protein
MPPGIGRTGSLIPAAPVQRRSLRGKEIDRPSEPTIVYLGDAILPSMIALGAILIKEENKMRKFTLFTMVLLLVVLAVASVASAQSQPSRSFERELPAHLESLKLDRPVQASGVSLAELDASLVGLQGDEKVIVRLKNPSVSERGQLTEAAAVRERNNLRKQQNALIKQIKALDPKARVIAQTQIVLNAVFVEVDASVLPRLANNPAVLRIAPVGNYEKDLSGDCPLYRRLGRAGHGL